MLIRKYKTMSKLGKTFLWLTIPIIAVFTLLYVTKLHMALNMDPNSFNCKYDSMMMQICHDPYGSSVGWTLILIGYFAWPVLLVWVVLGITLLIHLLNRRRDRHTTSLRS